LKMVLEDGSWVLIRPSGTEPLFRIYVEASGEEQLAQLQKEVLQSLGLS
ncbi:MAG: phosphoglucomutase/phosphomannomutase family protein, partial [Bacillota bacterium]|nr:phosphoglucomutase/phosphomannomutase family protein [Bacillota bacterium]